MEDATAKQACLVQTDLQQEIFHGLEIIMYNNMHAGYSGQLVSKRSDVCDCWTHRAYRKGSLSEARGTN